MILDLFFASRLLVTSSTSKTFEFKINDLHSAIRCACPPEILTPFSPTSVLSPSGRFLIKLSN